MKTIKELEAEGHSVSHCEGYEDCKKHVLKLMKLNEHNPNRWEYLKAKIQGNPQSKAGHPAYFHRKGD